MTAGSFSEKPPHREVQETISDEKSSPGKATSWRAILVTVAVTLVVSTIVFSAVGGILWHVYVQDTTPTETDTTSKEWIFWSRMLGDLEIHESAILDERENTALMISAEFHKAGGDNSLALHDFTTGYVALRDFNASVCYVNRIKYRDFEHVKQMVEERQGQQIPIQPLVKKTVRARGMASSELGPKLTEFCKGISAHWIDDFEERETNKDHDVKHRREIDIDSLFQRGYIRRGFLTRHAATAIRDDPDELIHWKPRPWDPWDPKGPRPWDPIDPRPVDPIGPFPGPVACFYERWDIQLDNLRNIGRL